MWWDQNEEYSQFTGDHAFLYKGYSLLTDGLAEGLDIRLSEEVNQTKILCIYYFNLVDLILALRSLLRFAPSAFYDAFFSCAVKLYTR